MTSGHDHLLLRDSGDLAAWRASLRRHFLGRRQPVRFILPSLSPSENRALDRRADRHLHACGCEAGGVVGMAFAFAAGVAWAVPATRPEATIANVALSVALIVGASTVAKLAALAWAHGSLVRMAARLTRFTEHQGSN